MTQIEISSDFQTSNLPKGTRFDQVRVEQVDAQGILFTTDSERSWVDLYRTEHGQSLEDKGVPEKSISSNQTIAVRSSERICGVEELWEVAQSYYRSRAFFIRQKNSNSRLLISHDLYGALVDSNRIFDKLGDFLLSFGRKQREHDIGPPPCRFAVDQTANSQARCRNFECAYGLRYVELNDYGRGKEPWSVRQTAVYHQYEGNRETWVFISASAIFETKVVEHLHQLEVDDLEKTNPFDFHLKLINAALPNWRWYIKSLVERATEQSTRVVAATVGQGKLSSLIDFEINFEDRQKLLIVEDRALDLLTIFESTSDTITSILEEYEFVYYEYKDSRSDRTLAGLRDCLREVELYRKKVEVLCKRIQATASLLSDLLDYENAKIAQGNGEALTVLAQESREENTTMRGLTEKATNDAAAVKVITLITIIFLPTTVVSGFFSTQFVRQSEDGNNLTLTENWWIIAAISIPLTIVTFTIWYCWVRFPWQRWWSERIRHSRNPEMTTQRRIGLSEVSIDQRRESESAFRESMAEGHHSFSHPDLHYRTSIGRDSLA